MRTPKAWSEFIKNGIITGEILEACLFSVNKRAKNWRNNARKYSDYYGPFDYVSSSENKRDEYYAMKDKLLSLVPITCLHKVFRGYETRRVYDYNKKYRKVCNRGNIVWCNCYFDYERGRDVWFVDVEQRDKPRYEYFEYRVLGNHSFHTPITQARYKELLSEGYNEEQLDNLMTDGKAVSDLVSVQFVRKVLELIDSGKYDVVLD